MIGGANDEKFEAKIMKNEVKATFFMLLNLLLCGSNICAADGFDSVRCGRPHDAK